MVALHLLSPTSSHPSRNVQSLLHPECEARAYEDDGAGGFLVLSLEAAGGHAVQAADLHPERGADGRAL